MEIGGLLHDKSIGKEPTYTSAHRRVAQRRREATSCLAVVLGQWKLYVKQVPSESVYRDLASTGARRRLRGINSIFVEAGGK